MKLLFLFLICSFQINAQSLSLGFVYTWNQSNALQQKAIGINGINAEVLFEIDETISVLGGVQNIGGWTALKIGTRGDIVKQCECKQRVVSAFGGLDVHYYLQGNVEYSFFPSVFGAALIIGGNMRLTRNVSFAPVTTLGFNTKKFYYGIGVGIGLKIK